LISIIHQTMLIKFGSVGEDVKRLQVKLGLTPDGSFGPVTELKVKEWQTINNLTSDGIIDYITWGILFSSATQTSNTIIPFVNFKLEKLAKKINAQVIAEIPETSARFNIINVLRLSHFLAQCAHESGGFKITSENLNYSADRLKVIFSKYFPGNLAETYANNPVKIGSRVYANQNGNADEASGEGFNFRGRGYIQLTGKNNYTSFARYVGEDTVANPDLVSTKYPLASAAFYFDYNKLWPICDRGETAEVVTAVTKAVNRGLIGLPDRISHFNEYYNLLK
jgi:putative chitinase